MNKDTKIQGMSLAIMKNGNIAVKASNKVMYGLLRQINGAHRCDSDKGMFITLPATRVNFMALEAIGNIDSMSKSYLSKRSEIMKPTEEQYEQWNSIKPKFDRELLEHQNDFCAFAYNKIGVINGSEQGTGKTIMAIALITAWHIQHDYKRILIVAPKDPLRQWEDEFYLTVPIDQCPAFLPLDDQPVQDRIQTLEGLSQLDEYIAVGINYDVMSNMAEQIKAFKPNVIIFDESWKFKTPKAAVTKAILNITKDLPKVFDEEKGEIDFKNSSRIILLNGTLFSNNVGDVWSQLVAITSLEQVGRYKDWMRDHAETQNILLPGGRGIIEKHIGIADPVGLVQKFMPYYWRASKESCLDLPEKLPVEKIYLPIDESLISLYASVEIDGESGMTANFDPDAEDYEEDFNPLLQEDFRLTSEQLDNLSLAGAVTKALRLQQITSGFLPSRITYGQPYIPPAEIEHEFNIDTKTYFLKSVKEEWLAQYAIENLLDNEYKRIIIWCKFNTDVYRNGRLLSSILGDHAVRQVRGGKGGMNSKTLNDVKESFNSRDKKGVRVLVAQMQRLSFGHNLQACDENILFSHSWSYLQRDQLEDRSHRYGRIGPVAYKELIATCDGKITIDHNILEATEAKELMANRLSRDTTAMFKSTKGT